MNGAELLRKVDDVQRERGIPREVIFASIEKALKLAILKVYDDEDEITVTIARDTGNISARKGDKEISPEELGRIAATSAKNQIIQSFKEEETNTLIKEFQPKKGEMIMGTVTRVDHGAATVSLGKTEAILPRSEQIPGETHHVGERVKAVILDVRKQGHRVRIVLSRTHPDFVRQLFEEEIPEIQDSTITIRAVAREAGYRSKVAVSSIDSKVDAVGACVGVRGSRIKNVVEELGGERIDIVRWNDSFQVLIQNALQPAAIEEVMLYPKLGRAIVLVKEDQLSLAIGRRGQNVRLASKLVGRDIEIMTYDELGAALEKAEYWFRQIPGVDDQVIEAVVTEGFLSFSDLTLIEASDLAEMAGISVELAEEIIAEAEERDERGDMEQEMEGQEGETSTITRPSPTDAATRLLGEAEPTPTEVVPTLDSLFRQTPDEETPASQEVPANPETPATPTEVNPEPEPVSVEQTPVESPTPAPEATTSPEAGN
jgi:N utilization substance protein A